MLPFPLAVGEVAIDVVKPHGVRLILSVRDCFGPGNLLGAGVAGFLYLELHTGSLRVYEFPATQAPKRPRLQQPYASAD